MFLLLLLAPSACHHAEQSRCARRGCRGELCMERSAKKPADRCVWQPSDGCYEAYGKCEVQADDACGFTLSKSLAQCLADPGGYGFYLPTSP